jgi:GntR family transcriptional regulator, transcriptional repressor for pyruvate dehydrogenase complex
MERKMAVPRLSDAVAGELEQRILEGSLRPGDRLQPERELAAELGVSRSSLREAIQKLVSRGMLSSRQGEGTFVTDRLEAAFSDPWENMVDSHPSVREDMLEFRHMLEAKAAECAAVRATDADRQLLATCYEKLKAAYEADDLEVLVDADLRFHQAVAEASHNAIIGHMTSSLLRLLRQHIHRNLSELVRMPEAKKQLQAQHLLVWRGVAESNPALARQAATEHIDFVKETLAEMARKESRRESALRRLSDV